MESNQNNAGVVFTETTDVVIDIGCDDNRAPPLYTTLCVCGNLRYCEATNQCQDNCIVHMKFVFVFAVCACFIFWPALFQRIS